MNLDLHQIRSDFPILDQDIHGHQLVYLDSAASTQKPLQVIDRVSAFYQKDYANIHRAVHTLSQRATAAYEGARERIATYLNAPSAREIIFVRGATEGINLVAQSYGRTQFKADDEILLTRMEHHANIVPWQLLSEQMGVRLTVVPMTEAGEVDLAAFSEALSDRTRLVAITHMSNSLGTVNPVSQMSRLAHDRGIPVLVDGAQSVPHLPVDVQDLECDFFVFSGHKAYGPTGIGVLWARMEFLEKMPPYQGGGDMILSVTFEGTTYNEIPYRFEAGTPHIAGAVGLATALDYLESLGWDAIQAHESDLLHYATGKLAQVPGLRFFGTSKQKGSIISFNLDGIHPHDVGTILDREGIAVRTGHHCCQPVMDFYGIPATTRASLALYNTREDIDRLVEALDRVKELLG